MMDATGTTNAGDDGARDLGVDDLGVDDLGVDDLGVDSKAADIVVVTKGLSEIEMAAITAVLSEAIAEATSNTVEKIPGPSAWQRSRRMLRQPIVPGPGAWTGFAG